MRKLITVGMTSFCLAFTMPMLPWANNIEETVTTAQENVATTTKYCIANNVNIRKEPNIESEVLGQAFLNTSFEVISDKDGWSKFFGEDDSYSGYGYIKSQYLSDKEIVYTEEDLYVLAHLIAGEAQPCDDMEQRYVASVVLNRVKHPGFSNTIKEVVFEQGQYDCIPKGTYYREPTERNWANAKWVLENGSVFPDYVIWQSKGKQGKGVYLKTKVHYYCY